MCFTEELPNRRDTKKIIEERDKRGEERIIAERREEKRKEKRGQKRIGD